MRDIPYAIITLCTYEALQGLVQRHRANADDNNRRDNRSNGTGGKKLTDSFCGSISGGVGTLLTNPMDVIQTRLMTRQQYHSVVHAATRILREEGLAVFLVGVTPRLMQKTPVNGLFFLFYESFKQLRLSA